MTLNLALIFKMVYIGRMLYINRPYNGLDGRDGFKIVTSLGPIWMLGAAGILNNCNWALFGFSVKYFDKKNTKFYQRVKFLLCSSFFVILVIMTIAYVTAMSIGGANPNPADQTLLKFIDWFGIVIHFIVCISFVITGLILK